jgi:hypothetical protein
MPPRKKPTREDIKSAADRAEKKTGRKKKATPLDPPVEDEELEEVPGGVFMRRPRNARGGRPTKYRPEFARIAKAMVDRGATISELAELFGVANGTIHLWQQTHTAFHEAFLELGSAYDHRVERSLADRAAGYTYDAVKIFQNKGQPVVVPYREHVPPDIGAIKMWLVNRKPDKWKEREEVKVSGGEAFLELWKRMGAKKE